MNKLLVCLIVSVCGLLAVGGCFAQHSEAIQKDSVCQIHFVGNLGHAIFTVQDNDNNFIYRHTKAEEHLRYSLQPGTYRVVVYKGSYPVVDRKMFFGDGQTQEIRVP